MDRQSYAYQMVTPAVGSTSRFDPSDTGAMGVRARGLDIKAGAAKLAAVIVRPWQKPSPGVDRTGAGPTRVPTMAFVNGSLTIRWQR
jgi:hypothetical protein